MAECPLVWTHKVNQYALKNAATCNDLHLVTPESYVTHCVHKGHSRRQEVPPMFCKKCMRYFSFNYQHNQKYQTTHFISTLIAYFPINICCQHNFGISEVGFPLPQLPSCTSLQSWFDCALGWPTPRCVSASVGCRCMSKCFLSCSVGSPELFGCITCVVFACIMAIQGFVSHFSNVADIK